MSENPVQMQSENGRRALAAASQYTSKYFLDETIGPLPEEIRKEVLVLLITITEEAGGIAVLGFEEDGEVYIESTCEEGDLGFDEVSAALLSGEMRREHAELMEQLRSWYLRFRTR